MYYDRVCTTMQETVLITGGGGLVGNALRTVLEKAMVLDTTLHEYDFVFLKREHGDLRDYNQVSRLFEAVKPTMVVHLAAKVGGVYDNANDKLVYLLDNTLITVNVAKACAAYNVRRIISVLSTCIFPNENMTYPLTIDQLHNGLPHGSNIGYAFAKRVQHVAFGLLADSTCVVNLVPTNVYGEHDNYNIDTGHVIPALVHKMYIAKQEGTPLYVSGDGRALRQFVYAEDLAKVLLHFLTRAELPTIVNCIVSPPAHTELSVQSLVSHVCDAMEYKASVEFVDTCTECQYKKTTDDRDITTWIPGFVFTPLAHGLQKTIAYFVSHYNHVRK